MSASTAPAGPYERFALPCSHCDSDAVLLLGQPIEREQCLECGHVVWRRKPTTRPRSH